jgi:hypothetical protein
MDSLMAGQEKAWEEFGVGSSDTSLFSVAMSLASARLESSSLSMVSVTGASKLPLDATWVSSGSDEAIEATSRPQMLAELASESEWSVSKWISLEPVGRTKGSLRS